MHLTRIVIVSSLLCATALANNTVVQAGYTDTVVATSNSGGFTSASGGLVEDSSGNLYVTNLTGVQQINLTTGVNTQFGANDGSGFGPPISLALSGNTLYEGFDDIVSTSNISTLPTDATSLGLLAGLNYRATTTVESETIAPADFGAYGGDLIIGTEAGIWAMNTTTGSSTEFSTGPTNVEGVAFGSNGALYATDNNGYLLKISPTGNVTILDSGLGSLGGLAIQQSTGDIFVADKSADELTEFSSTGASLGVFASGITWTTGANPSMLGFSADGSGLFYGETPIDGTSGGIHEITGFGGGTSVPNGAVPDATNTLAMLAIGLAACAAGSKRASRLRPVAR